LDAYHFDAARMQSLKLPVLILAGSETGSLNLKRAVAVLRLRGRTEVRPYCRTVIRDGSIATAAAPIAARVTRTTNPVA
jgi:hypothetical protein